MRWRQKLAELAGIPLPLMEGFYEPGKLTSAAKVYQCISVPYDIEEADRFLPIKWESLKRDPLHVLLNHSDCDGSIGWRSCKRLADRLEEFMPALRELPDNGGHIGNWAEKTQDFIDGLRDAYEAKETVRFG